MDGLFIIVALLVGVLAGWQAVSWFNRRKRLLGGKDVAQESQVLLERIEKVFKLVLAEGYFTEIYDHKTKKAFLGIFKTNSKALVIAKAKVSVGYDFAKMRFRRDYPRRVLVVEHFAEPEILATDTDYKFYDINQGLLNKFDNEDYTAIVAEAKKLMQEKARESDLPQLALGQIQLMMQQLCAAIGWQLEMQSLLTPVEKSPSSKFSPPLSSAPQPLHVPEPLRAPDNSEP